MKHLLESHRWLLLPLALLAVGRVLPQSQAWGFNHLAFLDRGFFLGWLLVAWGLVVAFQLGKIPALATRLSLRWPGLVALALGYGLLLAAFRVALPLLGDGLLILDRIGQGEMLREFDNLDYWLHAWLFRQWGATGSFSPGVLYRISSVAVGVLAVLALPPVMRSLSWPAPHRFLFVGLFLTGAPALLFFGYVESYTVLFLLLTLYLATALGTLDGTVPLRVPALLLGAAHLFHLTALFALPSFAVLLWYRRRRPVGELLSQGLLPVLAGLLPAVVLFSSQGMAPPGFLDGLSDGAADRGLLRPLLGSHGILSGHNLLQQINLLLLVFPVALGVFVLRCRRLCDRRREPRVRFLFTQILVVAIVALALNPKLGAARDWDLLVAHSAGFLLLACLPVAGKKDHPDLPFAPTLAVLVSALCLVPWVAVNARTESSLARFERMADTYPPYERAYAFETLGQWHREHTGIQAALPHYRRCVTTRPGNARFHQLLGSAFLELVRKNEGPERSAFQDSALASYLRALERDPGLHSVRDNTSRLLIQQGRYTEALPHLIMLTDKAPHNAVAWSSLGYVQLQLGEYPAAVTAFEKGLEISPELAIGRHLARAYLATGDLGAAYQTMVNSNGAGWRDPELVATFLHLAGRRTQQASCGPEEKVSLARAALQLLDMTPPNARAGTQRDYPKSYFEGLLRQQVERD